MNSETKTLLATSCLALLLAGCATTATRKPVPLPPVASAETFLGTEPESQDTGVTIIGGEGNVPSAPIQSRDATKPGDIRLNFPSADVRVVAKAVLGDLLRVPFTIAPGTGGSVTLVTPGPIARSSVLGVFENALKGASLALVPQNGGFTIMTTAAAQASGVTGPTTLGYSTEIIQLQFINAQELKKLLDSVVPGAVASVDAGTNSVTIAGTSGQRTNARDLIRQFDVNWLRNMSFAYFVPQRTDSRLIVPELEKLINAPDAPTRNLVRLIAMERLNGIIAVSAQRQYLEDVRRWIDVLDREGTNNEARLFVYRVQNGRSRDLARTINAAFGNGSSGSTSGNETAQPIDNNDTSRGSTNTPQPAQPPASAQPATAAGANEQNSERRGPAVTITSDDANNAVIIFGRPREYAIVEDALRKLDVAPYQVMIEAAITEVSLTNELRFGVQWNFQTGDSNFVLSDAGGSLANPIPTTALPGFSYFFSGNNISATLNALEERTNVKVVSAPKLMVLNNQTASLQVGDQVPIQTQSSQSTNDDDARIVNAIEYRDTGVILKVTPRVNAGGLVLLDIAQEVSDISSRSVSGIDSPIISTRRVSTSIAVQDGQVIALGGLFRDANSFGKNGLPILSRIPVLGSLLFGNRNDTQNRTELIILLKPHVLRTAGDARAVTEELRAKIRTLEPFKTEGRIP